MIERFKTNPTNFFAFVNTSWVDLAFKIMLRNFYLLNTSDSLRDPYPKIMREAEKSRNESIHHLDNMKNKLTTKHPLVSYSKRPLERSVGLYDSDWPLQTLCLITLIAFYRRNQPNHHFINDDFSAHKNRIQNRKTVYTPWGAEPTDYIFSLKSYQPK